MESFMIGSTNEVYEWSEDACKEAYYGRSRTTLQVKKESGHNYSKYTCPCAMMYFANCRGFATRRAPKLPLRSLKILHLNTAPSHTHVSSILRLDSFVRITILVRDIIIKLLKSLDWPEFKIQLRSKRK